MKLKVTYEQLVRLAERNAEAERRNPFDQARLPPDNEGEYMTAARSIRFVNEDEVMRHASSLVSYLKKYSPNGNNIMNRAESEAVHYFQFWAKKKGLIMIPMDTAMQIS